MSLCAASLVSDGVQVHQLGKRPNHSLQQRRRGVAGSRGAVS